MDRNYDQRAPEEILTTRPLARQDAIDRWAREIDSAPSPVMDDALTKCAASIRRLHLQFNLPLADLP